MSCYFKFNRTQIAVAQRVSAAPNGRKRADCNSRHERRLLGLALAPWAWRTLYPRGRPPLLTQTQRESRTRFAFEFRSRGWPNWIDKV